MRRLTLALALAGVVSAGCGGSVAGTSGGAGKGIGEGTFAVRVQNGQGGNTALQLRGGRVVSTPAGINCGVGVTGAQVCDFSFPIGTTVTLAATATGNDSSTPPLPYLFMTWAGDCQGDSATCALAGTADKYVLAYFTTAAERTGHANWTPGSIHGPKYFDHVRGVAGALNCTTCHGGNLQGGGLAPACSSCHGWPVHGAGAAPLFSVAPASGPAVTAKCLQCHAQRADQMVASNHFTWLGSSTSVGHTTAGSIGKRNVINNFCVANASNEARCMQCHPSYSVAPVKDGATGAVAVNTGPMYLWGTNAGMDKSRVDCLVCHADIATSRYTKSPANFGAPWITNSGACFPSCSAAQVCATTDSAGLAWSDGRAYCRAPTATETGGALLAGANNIGQSKRNNCGFCHFTAGGGDNVKMGDLASSLANPASQDVDVHMGSTASYAPNTCVKCHQAGSHTVKGTGLSIPVDNEGRLTCTDCHTGVHAPHVADAITPHKDFIACQTCHIPTFSRQLYTKVNWDWQTAADKQVCQGVPGCVPFGTVSYPAGNAQAGVVAGVGGEAPKGHDPVTQGYDWKKGVSTYARDVIPAYRWVPPATGQQGTHETTARNGLLGSGTPEDPFRLADLLPPDPVLGLGGWKIAPFKKMTGRSPAFADNSGMVVPHVFGMDSLWQNDLRGFPVVPNTLGSAANPWTQAKADAIWTGVNNYGAALGGQLGAAVATAAAGGMVRDAANLVTVTTVADLPAVLPATLYLVGAEAAFPTGVKTVTRVDARHFTYAETQPYTVNAGQPALPALPATTTRFVAFYPELAPSAWKWANTVMYINLNHEVAPPTTAVLGCSSCHPSMGGAVETSRMRELYQLDAAGCTDPMFCKKVNP